MLTFFNNSVKGAFIIIKTIHTHTYTHVCARKPYVYMCVYKYIYLLNTFIFLTYFKNEIRFQYKYFPQ